MRFYTHFFLFFDPYIYTCRIFPPHCCLHHHITSHTSINGWHLAGNDFFLREHVPFQSIWFTSMPSMSPHISSFHSTVKKLMLTLARRRADMHCSLLSLSLSPLLLFISRWTSGKWRRSRVRGLANVQLCLHHPQNKKTVIVIITLLATWTIPYHYYYYY